MFLAPRSILWVCMETVLSNELNIQQFIFVFLNHVQTRRRCFMFSRLVITSFLETIVIMFFSFEENLQGPLKLKTGIFISRYTCIWITYVSCKVYFLPLPFCKTHHKLVTSWFRFFMLFWLCSLERLRDFVFSFLFLKKKKEKIKRPLSSFLMFFLICF